LPETCRANFGILIKCLLLHLVDCFLYYTVYSNDARSIKYKILKQLLHTPSTPNLWDLKISVKSTSPSLIAKDYTSFVILLIQLCTLNFNYITSYTAVKSSVKFIVIQNKANIVCYVAITSSPYSSYIQFVHNSICKLSM
jgi:hypothetical protein